MTRKHNKFFVRELMRSSGSSQADVIASLDALIDHGHLRLHPNGEYEMLFHGMTATDYVNSLSDAEYDALNAGEDK